jgi:hypothetical protein
MARIQPTGKTRSGWVRISDVDVPGGASANKVWQDSPNNTVLQSADVSDLSVSLSISASSPIVEIDSIQYLLTLSVDGGHYEGAVDVAVSEGDVEVSVVGPDGDPGAVDNVNLTLVSPPEVTDVEFTGGYPGSQTELKSGDSFQLSGTTDVNADAIEILDFGAMVNSLEVIVEGTSFLITGTIADRGTSTQNLAARVRARSPITGAFGGTLDTDHDGSADGVNLVELNNTQPNVDFDLVTYPVTQQALKGSESADVDVTVTDTDSVVYDSPTGELSITNPTLDEATKSVTRIAGGYNVSTPNLRVVATRSANNAQQTFQHVVNIANDAAVITVLEPAARLQSGGNDGTSIQDHVITISSNQQLLSADMDEDTGGVNPRGVFTGSWAGGPSDWTRTLQVHDDHEKGTFAWQNLLVTNLAGVQTTSISGDGQYVLGGFVKRSLTFGPFATQTPMDVEVVDFSKVQAGIFTATNQPALRQPIGTPPSVTDGYTIDSVGVKPTQVIWLDTAAAGSNSGGTAQITDVEEVV